MAEEERDAARAEAAENARKVAAYEALYGKDGAPSGTPPAADQPGPSGRTYSEMEFNDAVEQRAAIMALQDKCNSMADEAQATYGDAFKDRIAKVQQEGFAAEMIKRVDLFDALTSLPNGAAVYHELIGDLDHLSDVLEMNPMKLGMELANMSAKLGAAPKPRTQISGVPAPIKPVDANSAPAAAFDADTASMDEYNRDYEARMKRRAEARGY
jgi:hypothetical protein